MAQQFSKVDQRRITFLSLLSSAAQIETIPNSAFITASLWLEQMEEEGFFEAGDTRPTPARSSGQRPTSGRQGSSSRPSNRGRDQQRGNGEFKGFRNPDAPATERQIAAAIKLGADYSEDELAEFSMQEISDLMSDLKS